jgi:hypothetical protein
LAFYDFDDFDDFANQSFAQSAPGVATGTATVDGSPSEWTNADFYVILFEKLSNRKEAKVDYSPA